MYAYDNYYRIDMKIYLVSLVYVLGHIFYALIILVANVLCIKDSVLFSYNFYNFIISMLSINTHIFSFLKRNMLILYAIPDPVREKPDACSANHCHNLDEKMSTKSVFGAVLLLSLNNNRSRLGG